VADTIEELARYADISGEALRLTIERYNADCEAGEDGLFFKKAAKLYPVRTGPFYAVEIRASMIGATHAGLEIDEHGHVVDRLSRVVDGLYAGGEVLGCTLGRRYIGGGIGIANALTFGRLAGISAARDGRNNR